MNILQTRIVFANNHNMEPLKLKKKRFGWTWPHTMETDIRHNKTAPYMEPTGQVEERKA